MNTMTTHVAGPRSQVRFEAEFHTANRLDDLQLDPESFYVKHAKTVPEFPHVEMQIVAPAENSEFWKLHKLHTHRSLKTNALFVCFPARIPHIANATMIWNAWCIGALLAVDHGIDLNTVFTQECKEDLHKYFDVTRNKYRIRIHVPYRALHLT